MAKRILIVDDEPEIIILVQRRLTKLGYDTITADSGLRGLETAKKEKPDLMILDVMMPELDGYQVCRMLKFDPEYQGIKIILCTSRDQQIDKEVGGEVNADAYITKPFEPDELIEKIKELIENK